MKRFYVPALLIITSFIYVKAISQPSIITQKVIGGDSTDLFTSIDITSDGGLIAGGNSYSGISGDKTQSQKGGSDFWIVKLNSQRQIVWNKTIGSLGNDDLKSIKQTPDGGYLLAGLSDYAISGDKTVAGNAWIVKLNASGNIVWDKTYINQGEDISTYGAQDLVLTKDGGFIVSIYVAGDTYSAPVWIVKADAAGNIQWTNTVGGETTSKYPSTITQTKDGGYLVGLTDFGHSSVTYCYAACKLDASGNIKWQKFYSFYNNDISVLKKVIETDNGSFILAGFSDAGTGTYKSQSSHDFYFDYWLLKIDSLGKYISDKVIGGGYNDYLMDAIRTKDNGLLLAGYSSSDASYEKTENNRGPAYSTNDYWLVKLDVNGNIQWQKTMGGSLTDNLIAVKEPKRNKFILGGYSYSGVSGEKTLPSKGDADFWLLGLEYNSSAVNQSSITKTDILEVKSLIKSIYPNPVKDILYIQTSGKTNIVLEDALGKTCLQKNINGNESINVSRLPAGTYYLKDAATGKAQKIVVIK